MGRFLKEKLQHDFLNMWGGGWRGGDDGVKAVWNFSKNSSDLVARPFPYVIFMSKCLYEICIFFKMGLTPPLLNDVKKSYNIGKERHPS